jgi:aconitate hydratase
MYLGVKAVLAKSMERIHHANLVNFGILPLTIDEATYDDIGQGDILDFPEIARELKNGKDITVRNTTKGKGYKATYTLSPRQVEHILAGGLLPYTADMKK